MRLWLILLVGLLCLAMTSCPAPEDEYADQQTTIDDEGRRQPEFTGDQTATTEGEEAVTPEEGEEGVAPAEGEEAGVTGEEEETTEMAPGEYCEKCGVKGCDGSCDGEGGYCTYCGVKGCDGSCVAAEEEVEEPAEDGEEEPADNGEEEPAEPEGEPPAEGTK